MSNQPRKHHYVPQFYLAGFTDDGTIDGNLHVIDTDRLREWDSKPKDAAHQRDFHRIEGIPGSDPMIVEKLLGQLEGKWSSVLRSVLERRSLPSDDTFGDLMMFIAFMAVRVPGIRERISTFIADVRRKQEFARNWLEQQGHPIQQASENTSDESDQTWHVQQMVRMATELCPLLSLRHWQLWVVDGGAPDLICSDSPVAPTWTVNVTGPYSPGFETGNTVVTFPLSKRMAMVSMLEADVGRRSLGRSEVAQLNSATGMYAGQLYCPAPDFVWIKRDGQIGSKEDLLEALRSRRS